MNKKTTLFILLIAIIGSMHAQTTVLQDFEGTVTVGTMATDDVSTEFGAAFSVIANPDTNGNTSANVGQYSRTSGNWFELINLNNTPSYTVTAGDTKYLHVYVWYPDVPDVSVRFNGGQNPDIRPTYITDAANNSFTAGQWQDIVFPLVNNTGGDITITTIRFLGDLGFQNANGQILDNVNNFAYLDNFRFNDNASQEVLSNDDLDQVNVVKIFPNPASDFIAIDSNIDVANVSIYNLLGTEVLSVQSPLDNRLSINNLTAGIYLVRTEDINNRITTTKLIIQ